MTGSGREFLDAAPLGQTAAGLPDFTMSAFPYSGSWIMRIFIAFSFWMNFSRATNAPPGSCQTSNTANVQLPYCHDVNVNMHHNWVTSNSSTSRTLIVNCVSAVEPSLLVARTGLDKMRAAVKQAFA